MARTITARTAVVGIAVAIFSLARVGQAFADSGSTSSVVAAARDSGTSLPGDGSATAAAPPAHPGWVEYYIVPAPAAGVTQSLQQIAFITLGNASFAQQIFQLNARRVQPDGGRLVSPDAALTPGWILELPAAAQGPGVIYGPLPAITPAPVSGAKVPRKSAAARSAATRPAGRRSLPAGRPSASVGETAAELTALVVLVFGLCLALTRRRWPAGSRRSPVRPTTAAPPPQDSAVAARELMTVGAGVPAWLAEAPDDPAGNEAMLPGGRHRREPGPELTAEGAGASGAGGEPPRYRPDEGKAPAQSTEPAALRELDGRADHSDDMPHYLTWLSSDAGTAADDQESAGNGMSRVPDRDGAPADAAADGAPGERAPAKATYGPSWSPRSAGDDDAQAQASPPEKRRPQRKLPPAALHLLGASLRKGKESSSGSPVQRLQVMLGSDKVEVVLTQAPAAGHNGKPRSGNAWLAASPYLAWTPLPYEIPDGGTAFACLGTGDEGCLFIDLAAAPGFITITGDIDSAARLTESLAHQVCRQVKEDSSCTVVLVDDVVPEPHPPGAVAARGLRDLGLVGPDVAAPETEIVFCTLRESEDALVLARYASRSAHRVVPVVLAELPGAPWSFCATAEVLQSG